MHWQLITSFVVPTLPRHWIVQCWNCKVKFTMSSQRRSYNIKFTLLWHDAYQRQIVVSTRIRCQMLSKQVKLTTSFQRRHYEVAPTLLQLCEERQIWSINGHMLAFPQCYLNNAIESCFCYRSTLFLLCLWVGYFISFKFTPMFF